MRDRSRISLRNHFLGIVSESARLRHQLQSLDHVRIGFRSHLQAFFLAKGIHEEFTLDVGAQPLVALDHLGFGVRYFLFVEEFAEVQQHGIVHFKVLRDFVRDGVALGEVKKRVVLQQRSWNLLDL